MEDLGGRTLNRPWRLIVSGPASGAWNMALDEALFRTVCEGGAPFLRFYTWDPDTLSLGRFQNLSTGLSPLALIRPLVRRSTGGGAIWHSAELTYSLGCAQSDLPHSGVKASFETLCQFLIDVWRLRGWKACYAKDGKGPQDRLGAFTPACFAGREDYDILVEGKKLGGNAQRREREQIFQHGSIPLCLDWDALNQLFLPEARPVAGTVTDLAQLGWMPEPGVLIEALAERFFAIREAEWQEVLPSDLEVTRAAELEQSKYAARQWTENGGGLRPVSS